MAGRYTGSYLDQSNGWRAAAILADIGQASLGRRIPTLIRYDFCGSRYKYFLGDVRKLAKQLSEVEVVDEFTFQVEGSEQRILFVAKQSVSSGANSRNKQ